MTVPSAQAAGKTSYRRLGEIAFARDKSAGEVAASVGVTPKRAESGTSLKTINLSKMGNGRIRKGLYFPAIVAMQHNAQYQRFCQQIKTKRKNCKANS